MNSLRELKRRLENPPESENLLYFDVHKNSRQSHPILVPAEFLEKDQKLAGANPHHQLQLRPVLSWTYLWLRGLL